MKEWRRWRENGKEIIYLLFYFSSIPSAPPFFLFFLLVALTQNCHMMSSLLCVHIHLLSSDWQISMWKSKHINQISMCSYLETSSFFCKSFPSLFLFSVIHNSALSFFTWSPSCFYMLFSSFMKYLV